MHITSGIILSKRKIIIHPDDLDRINYILLGDPDQNPPIPPKNVLLKGVNDVDVLFENYNDVEITVEIELEQQT